MAKPHTAVGITIVRAPGGGLVLVQGPMDLSKAKSLSPAWTREVKATRPGKVLLAPDPENGRRREVTVPVLQKVGEARVHGESAGLVARRGNRELAELLEAAVAGKDVPLEVLEAMVPEAVTTKPFEPPHADQDKRMQAERAMGFFGLPDAVVRKRLLAMGRKKSDVDRYISERAELAA